MTEKVETYCAHKRTKTIFVELTEYACINCIWFEQHYRPNRSNIYGFVPISKGTCLLTGKIRGVLWRPCRHFEKMRKNPIVTVQSIRLCHDMSILLRVRSPQ